MAEVREPIIVLNKNTGDFDLIVPNRKGEFLPKGSDYAVDKESDNTDGTKKSAKKEYVQASINTLSGDMSVMPRDNTLPLQCGQTIVIHGIGKYLSGKYLISDIKTSVASGSFSKILTLKKTGFADSVKPNLAEIEAIRKKEATVDKAGEVVIPEASLIKVGDSVWIADDAVYSGAVKGRGVKVPDWVISRSQGVYKISADGLTALLQPINSWVELKYLRKEE